MTFLKTACLSVFAAGLGACGPSPGLSKAAGEPSAASADVELLDSGVTLDPAAIVFTAGTVLSPAYQDSAGHPQVFATNVIKIAEAKYVGYLLPVAAGADGTFSATGALQGYIARYATPTTTFWETSGVTPDAPGFTTQDMRSVASSPRLVSVPGVTTGTLRIYVSQIRTAYSSGTYTYQPGLMLFHVNPLDGRRTSFIYSPGPTSAGLFSVAAAAVPASRDAASLVNIIAAADTTTALHPGSPEQFQVPWHTFVGQSFRVVGGQSFRDSATPLGVAAALDSAETAALTSAWTAIQADQGALSAPAYAALLALASRLSL